MLSCSPPTLSCGRKNYFILLYPRRSPSRPYAPPPCVRVQRELHAVPMFRDVPQTTPLPSSIPASPIVCQPRHRLAHLTPRDTTPLLKFPFETVPSCTHVPLLSLRSFPVPRACHCSPHTRHHTHVHPFACADSRSSRNLVRHPSLSRPRPCHTHWTPSFAHSSPHPTRLTQRVPLFISARRRARTCNGVLASGRASSLLPPTVSVRYAFPISQQSPCASPCCTCKSLCEESRVFGQPRAHATLTAPRWRRGGGTPRPAEGVRAGASCRSRRPARTERARADSEDGWRPPRRQSPLSRRRATHGP